MELVNKPRAHYAALMDGANRAISNTGSWQDRHRTALRTPLTVERRMLDMLVGWARYADTHRASFGSGIGDDYVLGPAWERIGRGIRELVNADCGRFDCGTLDSFILDSLKAEGFKEE